VLGGRQRRGALVRPAARRQPSEDATVRAGRVHAAPAGRDHVRPDAAHAQDVVADVADGVRADREVQPRPRAELACAVQRGDRGGIAAPGSSQAVTPTRAGANRIELTLPRPTTRSGGYSEVRVRATLEAAGKDLALTAVRGADPRTFAVRRAYLPTRGNWTLRISARRGSERFAGTVALPVR
jgi:hypothetical protein